MKGSICAGCAEDFHCEYSRTSCTLDTDCDGIFTDTCIKDGNGGGVCAAADTIGCFFGTAFPARTFADDSEISVCKIAEVCDAGRCATRCSLQEDCTTLDAVGGDTCNTTTGACDTCASGNCPECRTDAECDGKGGSCVDGSCSCADTADCSDIPTYGGTATCE